MLRLVIPVYEINTHQFGCLELFALLVEAGSVLSQPLLHQEPVLLRKALVAPDLEVLFDYSSCQLLRAWQDAMVWWLEHSALETESVGSYSVSGIVFFSVGYFHLLHSFFLSPLSALSLSLSLSLCLSLNACWQVHLHVLHFVTGGAKERSYRKS